VDSKTHINELHGFLDSNCRLLKKDLIELQNFWDKYLNDKKVSSLNEHRAKVEWLFTMQREFTVRVNLPWSESIVKKDNTRYYYHYLFAKRAQLVNEPLVNSEDGSSYTTHSYRILSSIERQGHGYGHFSTKLFNETLTIECFLSKNKEHIIVRLIINEFDLTEELTYKLGQLPMYEMSANESSASGGIKIPLAYSIPSTDLVGLLTEYENPNCHGCKPEFIASNEFITELGIRMKQIGILDTSIEPIF
jgi:hypothetical protein